MLLFLFLPIWCTYFPDLFLYLFKPLICKFKKKIHDGRLCHFFICKHYFSCRLNGKCMNDVKFSTKPIYPFIFYVFDVLLFLSTLLFGVIGILVFYVIFGIITY